MGALGGMAPPSGASVETVTADEGGAEAAGMGAAGMGAGAAF